MGPEQSAAFEKLKEMMTDSLTLGYYDVRDKAQVIADASPVGLGSILIQIDELGRTRIISYASRSLSDVERRYAQTEKNALAQVH